MRAQTEITLHLDRRAFNVALARCGLNITQLAQQIPISRTRLCAIVAGAIPKPELRGRIARLLATDERSLWIDVAPVVRAV